MDIYKRENKAYFIYNELNRQHFFPSQKKTDTVIKTIVKSTVNLFFFKVG